MQVDLLTLSLCLIVFSFAVYIIKDGAEIGLGIMYPFVKNLGGVPSAVRTPWWRKEIWLMISSAGWLVIFPDVASIVVWGFLSPLVVLLIAQAIRLYSQAQLQGTINSPWGWGFFGGSLVATVAQGIILGGAIHGFEFLGNSLVPASTPWLTPLSAFCSLGLVFAYAQLGMSWYTLQPEATLNDRVYKKMTILAAGLLVAVLIVCLWMPLIEPKVSLRWFSWPQILYLAPIPLFTAWAGFLLWISLMEQRRKSPYVLTVTIFVLCMVGLMISTWPYILPWKYKFWEIAGDETAQLLGFVTLLVSILTALHLEIRSRKQHKLAEA